MSTFPCSLPRDCRYFEVSASMMNMTNDPRSKAVIHWRLFMLLSWSPRAHLYVVGMLRFMFWHKPTELAHSFLSCSCFYFCIYCPFNCISFHTFSRQLSAFSFCSSGLISALLVLSTVYLFMKFSLSPDIILCDWLGWKHQLSHYLTSSMYLYKKRHKRGISS